MVSVNRRVVHGIAGKDSETAGHVINFGKERYRSALAAPNYGNQEVGNEVNAFWLNGDLKVSACEQINFLGKLSEYTTPNRLRIQ